MIKQIEYKGIYRINYFPKERADSVHITDICMKPKVFEGIIENFYPGGKCVFYNEITEQILAIPYECIRCIYPIDEYYKRTYKLPLFEPDVGLSSEEISEVIKPFMKEVNDEQKCIWLSSSGKDKAD